MCKLYLSYTVSWMHNMSGNVLAWSSTCIIVILLRGPCPNIYTPEWIWFTQKYAPAQSCGSVYASADLSSLRRDFQGCSHYWHYWPRFCSDSELFRRQRACSPKARLTFKRALLNRGNAVLLLFPGFQKHDGRCSILDQLLRLSLSDLDTGHEHSPCRQNEKLWRFSLKKAFSVLLVFSCRSLHRNMHSQQ